VNTAMNLGFHKMLGSSWVAAQLTASQEGLSSMSEWVIILINSLPLIICTKVLAEKLMVVEIVKKLPAFYENRWLGSQEATIESCCEPNKSNPNHVICLFLKNCFNINFTSTPRASKSPSPFRLPIPWHLTC
jgi:hypothetical protein